MSTSVQVGVVSQSINNSESELRKLAQSSSEAKAIFDNFAGRKRIHRDALLMIRVLYASFIKKGIPLKKSSFDRVFFELERLGYGLTEKYPNGDLKAFLPEISLKYIGMTAQPIAKTIQVVSKPAAIAIQSTVKISFEVNGRRCEAEVPMDKVQEFTARLSN